MSESKEMSASITEGADRILRNVASRTGANIVLPSELAASRQERINQIRGEYEQPAAATVGATVGATAAIIEEATKACIAANTKPGIVKIWDLFSSIAYIIITIVVVGIIGFSVYYSDTIKEVKKNWSKYRCQPSIMPFAFLYGHNTAENFQYCMGNIFQGSAMEVAGPFAGMIGSFAQTVGASMNGINSLRQSVATMGGGINVIFQDFTDRIKNFFFQLRLSAIRMKNLLTRMYTILFSIMYMGLSGMTAASNFGNTILFAFLDAFCFPPETEIDVKAKGKIPLYKVTIGDILADGSRVTAKFHFAGQGQQMVSLDKIQVSTNHYVYQEGNWIKAVDHPDAIPIGSYSRNSLICLNTDTHRIPIGSYTFRDYDEGEEADEETMTFIEERLNGVPSSNKQSSNENNPVFHPDTEIKLEDGTILKARDLQVGDRLSTGAQIGGIVHKELREVCPINETTWMGSATLVWNKELHRWTRAASIVKPSLFSAPVIGIGLIALTNSQIELANGIRVRDYMELCSPDSERFYEQMLSCPVIPQS